MSVMWWQGSAAGLILQLALFRKINLSFVDIFEQNVPFQSDLSVALAADGC